MKTVEIFCLRIYLNYTFKPVSSTILYILFAQENSIFSSSLFTKFLKKKEALCMPA